MVEIQKIVILHQNFPEQILKIIINTAIFFLFASCLDLSDKKILTARMSYLSIYAIYECSKNGINLNISPNVAQLFTATI